jgi:hypothetical protein
LSTARIEWVGLSERSALIAPAALGELPPIPLDKIPLDSGDGEYCTAYRWNEALTAYRSVDLRRNGSPAAASLSRWLEDIEQALMQSPFNAIPSELARIAEATNEEIRRKAEARHARVSTVPTAKDRGSSPSKTWRVDPAF